jgi:membrane protein implicated in regulation of membrane protease activity
VLALTGSEWAVLVVAIGPAVLAVALVWIVWRWGKRSDAEQAERERNSDEGG